MNTEVGKTQAAPPGVTKAKWEEVKTPLGIRLDDFGCDSCSYLYIGVDFEYPKALGCRRVHDGMVLFIMPRSLLHWEHGKGTNKTMCWPVC
jgi:hypothetical protein